MTVVARARRASSRGMTLVEVLISITILVLCGVGVAWAYQSSLHLSEVSQQASVAVNDLKDMLERIKATPFSQLTANFPNGVANGAAGYTVAIGGYTLPSEQITVTHSPNTAADPRELIVQVTWANGGRVYQRSSSTMRSSQAS